MADLGQARGALLGLLLLELHLVEAGAQHLHAHLAVLNLRALVLGLHHGVGGQVRDAHGGVGGVDALTAGAGRAVGVDAQVGLVDLDVDLVGLGEHRHGGRGGLDAALALGLGDALDAVHAGLVLHHRVDLLARDLELDGLEAAGLRRARGEDLDLPAAPLAEALVHLIEVAGKDGGLVAAHARADLDDGVLLVVGVGRDEQELDVVLERGELGLVGGDVLLEHGLLVGVRLVQHLLGGVDVVERPEVLAGLGHELGLAGVLLGEARVLLGVGDHGGVHELLLELLVGDDDLGELVSHDDSFGIGRNGPVAAVPPWHS